MKESKLSKQKNIIKDATMDWMDKDQKNEMLEIMINQLTKNQRDIIIEILKNNYQYAFYNASLALGYIEAKE